MEFEIVDYNAMRDALHTMCEEMQRCSIPEQGIFDCKLVACELLSNVLQHGGGKAYLHAELKGGVAFLHVRAEREWRPPDESECSSVESERGRGLFLVDAVCESRSYSPEQGICVTVRVIGK